MSVTSSDIYVYGAANMPEDDSSTTGGAIDRTIKMAFTALTANDTIDVVSDAAGDTTQTVTITGRLANGEIDTDALALNGITPVTGTVTFERILKVVVSATYVGTLTFSDGDSVQGTLFTMEGSGANPGGSAVLEMRRIFYGAAANASGGAVKNLHEKVFVANTNASTSLTSATVAFTDGTDDSLLDFKLEDAVNDTESVANRLTEPTGVSGSWDDTTKDVPGNNLGDRTTGTSDHIGVWVKLNLPSGQSPEKADLTLTVEGNTT